MHRVDNYDKYDDMSSEELTELLRQDFLKTGNENLDEEAILYITQILVNREDDNPTGLFGNLDVSWENFCHNFIVPADICPGAGHRTSSFDIVQPCEKKRSHIRVLRTTLIAAVITVLLIGAGYAAGILGWIPGWTNDYFSFSGEEKKTTMGTTDASGINDCDSLEEAFALHDAPSNIFPTVLPEEYEEIEFSYSHIPDGYTTFGCLYSDGENSISLSYCITYNGDFSIFSKDEGAPEAYTAGGIEHYIMTNEGRYGVVWQNGVFECSLSGFENREELIQAIESMY